MQEASRLDCRLRSRRFVAASGEVLVTERILRTGARVSGRRMTPQASFSEWDL